MAKAYLSINSHVIRRNATRGTNDPPIRIARRRTDARPTYAREVTFAGKSRLVYSAHSAILRCGARMVLEVDGDTLKVIR